MEREGFQPPVETQERVYTEHETVSALRDRQQAVLHEWELHDNAEYANNEHQQKMAWDQVLQELPPDHQLHREVDQLFNTWEEYDKVSNGVTWSDQANYETHARLQRGEALRQLSEVTRLLGEKAQIAPSSDAEAEITRQLETFAPEVRAKAMEMLTVVDGAPSKVAETAPQALDPARTERMSEYVEKAQAATTASSQRRSWLNRFGREPHADKTELWNALKYEQQAYREHQQFLDDLAERIASELNPDQQQLLRQTVSDVQRSHNIKAGVRNDYLQPPVDASREQLDDMVGALRSRNVRLRTQNLEIASKLALGSRSEQAKKSATPEQLDKVRALLRHQAKLRADLESTNLQLLPILRRGKLGRAAAKPLQEHMQKVLSPALRSIEDELQQIDPKRTLRAQLSNETVTPAPRVEWRPVDETFGEITVSEPVAETPNQQKNGTPSATAWRRGDALGPEMPVLENAPEVLRPPTPITNAIPQATADRMEETFKSMESREAGARVEKADSLTLARVRSLLGSLRGIEQAVDQLSRQRVNARLSETPSGQVQGSDIKAYIESTLLPQQRSIEDELNQIDPDQHIRLQIPESTVIAVPPDTGEDIPVPRVPNGEAAARVEVADQQPTTEHLTDWESPVDRPQDVETIESGELAEVFAALQEEENVERKYQDVLRKEHALQITPDATETAEQRQARQDQLRALKENLEEMRKRIGQYPEAIRNQAMSRAIEERKKARIRELERNAVATPTVETVEMRKAA